MKFVFVAVVALVLISRVDVAWTVETNRTCAEVPPLAKAWRIKLSSEIGDFKLRFFCDLF